MLQTVGSTRIERIHALEHDPCIRYQTNYFYRGVPYNCILVTSSVSLLTYLSCSAGASQVFAWFQNLATIASLFTWMSVSIAYIRFHAALKVQGISRRLNGGFPFRSRWQPYTAWFSLLYFGLITIFNGFYTFPYPSFSSIITNGPSSSSSAADTAAAQPATTSASNTNGTINSLRQKPHGQAFDTRSFITAYIGIPIYFSLYLAWKVFKRTRVVDVRQADILTGKGAVDAADRVWEERYGEQSRAHARRRREGGGMHNSKGVGVGMGRRVWETVT